MNNPETHTTEMPKPYIVAIGASAGGLEAIQDFFDNIPGDTGFCFVIVQHLSPDHKSLLGEILSKHTTMTLFESEEGMCVKPNCVYLIPSRKTMTISEGRLLLKDKSKERVPNNAIDIFFESLAADAKERAIGIILSGTGTDGTKGIEAIKKAGGIVIVQDPMTATFDGMPNSAIATGFADLILPPEMIGDELTDLLKENPSFKTFNLLNNQEEQTFKAILELVKNETSHDFTLYKLPTLNRRLAKRMYEKSISSLLDYYALLLNDPAEVRKLAKEFLINVTRFFRDPEAFEILRTKIIPSLFTEKQTAGEIKVWVVACSTGEEAYSIAILLQEYLEAFPHPGVSIKIFATDIDQEVVNIAARGEYPRDAVKDIPPEVLNKYFIKEGNTYTISAAIRKMVVFAKHDVLKDPPFSKIDLLSCRNMLIYMNALLQKSVLRKFHFALSQDRYLFLGPSETPAALSDYFTEVDKKWKLFKCIFKAKAFDNDIFLAPSVKDTAAQGHLLKSKNALNHLAEIFKDTLLDEYQMAGILIDKDLEVKQAIGNFKNFMRFPEENFNFNLQKLLPVDLSIAVSMAVRKAVKSNGRVVMKDVKIAEDKTQRRVNVIVKPYSATKEYLQPFIFIILQEVEKAKLKVKRKAADTITTTGRIEELEDELKEVRENLQSVIEELESANEELQTSNEEIISSNEELQSTNEELQSLNEELHTVNAEHQLKIKELIELNDDLNNYFSNSEIGQILIDKNLLVKRFTPAAKRQINLIESDIGRSITDISTNIRNLDFIYDVKNVMKSGNVVEKEVVMENGRINLMRISPYVRQDKTIDGVVVNFIDISDTKRLNSIIEAVFNNSPNSIIALRALKDRTRAIRDFELMAANVNACKFLNKGEPIKGKRLLDDNLEMSCYYTKFVEVFEKGARFQTEHYDKKNSQWYSLIATKMMDGLIVTLSDITYHKQATNLLSESYGKLKHTSDELSLTISKLEQSNYDLMQFASVASHDLKEPLRKIQLFGSMLKGKIYSGIGNEEKVYLDKMISASHRMQNLIDDILTFSKLSNHEAAFVPSDLSEIVRQILEDIEVIVKDKDAVINVNPLPVIKARSGQMRQLFQNLISNSLKFTAGKPPVINIRQSAPDNLANGPGYACIEVEDNGIGFEEQYKDKIFGLFQRLHGNSFPGTGLGLAICKKIVENHNGFITVESKPGQGAKFRIALPVDGSS